MIIYIHQHIYCLIIKDNIHYDINCMLFYFYLLIIDIICMEMGMIYMILLICSNMYLLDIYLHIFYRINNNFEYNFHMNSNQLYINCMVIYILYIQILHILNYLNSLFVLFFTNNF